jgi:hypothetical protein
MKLAAEILTALGIDPKSVSKATIHLEYPHIRVTAEHIVQPIQHDLSGVKKEIKNYTLVENKSDAPPPQHT